MYVSFLAGCFPSVRFGLEEAHGKVQALQFNYLFEKGAFVLHFDETFSVDFEKVEDSVTNLSRESLTIQARGDKEAARTLLQKYGVMRPPLKHALEKLVQVPVDLVPDFPIANQVSIDKCVVHFTFLLSWKSTHPPLLPVGRRSKSDFEEKISSVMDGDFSACFCQCYFHI